MYSDGNVNKDLRTIQFHIHKKRFVNNEKASTMYKKQAKDIYPALLKVFVFRGEFCCLKKLRLFAIILNRTSFRCWYASLEYRNPLYRRLSRLMADSMRLRLWYVLVRQYFFIKFLQHLPNEMLQRAPK